MIDENGKQSGDSKKIWSITASAFDFPQPYTKYNSIPTGYITAIVLRDKEEFVFMSIIGK